MCICIYVCNSVWAWKWYGPHAAVKGTHCGSCYSVSTRYALWVKLRLSGLGDKFIYLLSLFATTSSYIKIYLSNQYIVLSDQEQK